MQILNMTKTGNTYTNKTLRIPSIKALISKTGPPSHLYLLHTIHYNTTVLNTYMFIPFNVTPFTMNNILMSTAC